MPSAARTEQQTGAPLLITVAPAVSDLGHLLRVAVDAEHIGATRLHLPAGQPDPVQALAALREHTNLVLTCDPASPPADFADTIGTPFTEVVLDEDDPAELVSTVASLVGAHPEGISVGGRGHAALSVLFAAIAAGAHIRIGTADSAPPAAPSGRQDDTVLVARAVGLARIAGRPPMDAETARDMLGVEPPRGPSD